MSNSSEEIKQTTGKNGSCKLVFHNYYVEEVEFKYNKEYKSGSSIPIEFEMASEIENINEDRVNVRLIISIFDDAITNNKPFEMRLSIIGKFAVHNYSQEDNYLLEQNTLSILFPFARAVVSTYTAGANITSLILPPVNIVEYMKEKEKAQRNKQYK